jgi:hypothetical protein
MGIRLALIDRTFLNFIRRRRQEDAVYLEDAHGERSEWVMEVG